MCFEHFAIDMDDEGLKEMATAHWEWIFVT